MKVRSVALISKGLRPDDVVDVDGGGVRSVALISKGLRLRLVLQREPLRGPIGCPDIKGIKTRG